MASCLWGIICISLLVLLDHFFREVIRRDGPINLVFMLVAIRETTERGETIRLELDWVFPFVGNFMIGLCCRKEPTFGRPHDLLSIFRCRVEERTLAVMEPVEPILFDVPPSQCIG